ncbi:MAG: phytanoyl-CoA dioxygenase family protein [Pirellulaceae bacterium]
MDTRFTNSQESQSHAELVDTDWTGLTLAERIKWVELEGFVVIPNLLTAEQIQTIGAELDTLPTTPRDYSTQLRGNPHGPWPECPEAARLVALPAMIEFLSSLFGDELICTSYGYDLSLPGHPGIAIHTDSQPYGSEVFGVQASSPVLARVLYYLDDLTPQRAPFKVIPRSHLSMHRDGLPYNRYLAHDGEQMVTCSAGSAVVINQKVFHGNYPNYSNERRRLLAIAYRPAWAGPIADVPERDPERIGELPPEVQPLMGSLNARRIDFNVPNRPDNLETTADGIHPARWAR